MPKTATKTKNITVHSDEIITASSTRPSRTITNTNNPPQTPSKHHSATLK